MTITKRSVNLPLLLAAVVVVSTNPANAHVSEQGFVLLLPTDAYIAAGIGIILATLIFLAIFHNRSAAFATASRHLFTVQNPGWLPTLTSLISTAILATLLVIGLTGPRDPLTNLLPLTIWTIWWILFPIAQGLLGDIWSWLNPWTGINALATNNKMPPLTLPTKLGHWPACLGFGAFSAFALADPAPDDPARLATFVGGYWLITALGIALFGAREWLARCECFTILLSLFAALSPFQYRKRSFGVPGHGLLAVQNPPISLGIFALLLLSVGSFDGLNETFWWLAQIGVNPLAFPGRSAVILPTLAGMAGFTVCLCIIFGFCVWLGKTLANNRKSAFWQDFSTFALTVLPIAFGYHVAHYLTALMVNGQYAIAALTDPLATGADHLNLGTFYVTTGFFNTQSTVRLIWLTQASAVVASHVLALILAHTTAQRLYGAGRPALVSQIPMALFMVAYTLLGLWLLAAPKGA